MVLESIDTQVIVKQQVVQAQQYLAEAVNTHATTEAVSHGPHISIKGEKLFEFLGLDITNSLFTSWIVLLLLIAVALIYTKKGKLYHLINLLLRALYGLFEPIFGVRTSTFFPLAATFFIFILSLNWFGLIPGVGTILFNGGYGKVPLLRAGTADLNTTIALGVFSVFLIQVFAIKYLGIKKYVKKFINITNPIYFFVGILEIISEISKAISFSFRLFGNIFAGEVLLTVIAFLVPVFIPATFPFLIFEFFVGFIQALVFSMLSAIMLSVSIKDHSH
jgi:F-type H+-transporting ATPase subunit a